MLSHKCDTDNRAVKSLGIRGCRGHRTDHHANVTKLFVSRNISSVMEDAPLGGV